MQHTPAIKAITIPVDGPGQIQWIERSNQSIRALVNGWIEAVYTMYTDSGEPQAIFWCNEHSKIDNLPINRRATAFWYALAGGPTGDTLNGTVVITGGIKGENITSVPEVLADVWESVKKGRNP